MRHFVSGPESWGWTGRCMVNDAETAYQHHPDWPVLTPKTPWIDFVNNSVSQILAKRLWIEVVSDPDLAMDEGL